jgi:MFS family permease
MSRNQWGWLKKHLGFLALRGNVWILAAITFLGGIRLSMVLAVWQPFALSLGASMPTLGLLESLGGRMGLATGLIQPLGGRLSDRVGRKPLLALASLVAALGLSCYVLAAMTGDWRPLIGGMILVGLAAISIPAKDAMTAESVDRRICEKRPEGDGLQRDYVLRRCIGHPGLYSGGLRR